jgi:hypothetical protein
MNSKKKLRKATVRKAAPTPKPTSASAIEPVFAANPEPSRETTPPTAVIAALENALAAVRDLSAQRLRAKLSVSRLMGVTRELKELLKVMSVYGV